MQIETTETLLHTTEIRFGGAHLDSRRRALVDETGRKSELRSKTYDVLALLIERADSVVSKDDLFDRVWNGVAVSEDTLVQCITEIRKAIGPKGHDALKTITKVGYRLVPDPSTPQITQTPQQAIRSIHPRGIAVLPFANLGGDQEQDFLADGLAEDVITDLSGSSDLFVIARHSSFSFRHKTSDLTSIASELGVRYLVEGSVRKSGSRLRITAQLVDVQNNSAQVWAERYDREYVDVFDIQDDIARQVVGSIVGKLTADKVNPRQRPMNMEAYELSLRSRSMWTKSKADCDEAIVMLTRSVRLDPVYARTMQPEASHMADALKHSYRAIELDPQDPIIRATHGFVLLHAKKWEEADHELDTALAMNPNGAHTFALKAYLEAAAGQGVEAVDLMDAALKLNPRPPTWYYFHVAFCQLVKGSFAECIKILRRPEFARSALRRTLVLALELDGKHEEATKEAELYMAYDPTYRVSQWLDRLPYRDDKLRQLHIEASVRAGIPE
jgi:TolB-like protein